jgi:hypothetical protein
MARKTGALFTGETIIARSATGGVIAIDSATLSDANYPAVDGKVTGGIDCSGYDTIFVGVEVTVPGTSTMTLEPLFYDPDGAVDAKLSRLLLGAAPGVTLAALASEATPALPGTNTSVSPCHRGRKHWLDHGIQHPRAARPRAGRSHAEPSRLLSHA